MVAYIQVLESEPSPLEDQRRLTTLEPRMDLSMLPLTLVTPSGRLALARRRTTANPNPLLVRPLVVRQAGENGRIPGLYRERGEQVDQRGLL